MLRKRGDDANSYPQICRTPVSNPPYFVAFVISFENTAWRGLGQFKQNPSIASFQHGVLESRLTRMFPEASLRTWMPAIHAGMTNLHFHILWASVSS